MKKVFNGLLWGACFIALGVLFLGNILELWDFNVFFKGWWTLFIIIPSFIGVIASDDRAGSAICLIIGSILMMFCRDVLSFEQSLYAGIACCFIILGLKFIIKAIFVKKTYKLHKSDWNGEPDVKAIFGNSNSSFKNKEVKNMETLAVFGSIVLDLRGAKFNGEVLINAVSVFGSTKIYADNDVEIVINGTNVLGGTNNQHNADEKKNKVYVDSVSVFGGLEVL